MSNPNVEPARPLVLTRDQHALLGELVEIMGFIEGILIETAERLAPEQAQILRKATAGNLGRLWEKAIIDRVSDSAISVLIPVVRKNLEELAEDRNDFIHAMFEGVYVVGYMQPGYQATTAARSKSGTSRPTTDLQSIRDRAAELSHLVSQVANSLRNHRSRRRQKL